MNYNFKVINIKTQVTSGSLSNVVQRVKYNVHCTGSDNAVYTKAYNIDLNPVASSDFVAWGSLTEDKVNAWVTGSSGWSGNLTAAENFMNSKVSPTETWGLPWSSSIDTFGEGQVD